MKVTKHARKRFKQRLGSISTGSYQFTIEQMFKNSIPIGEWVKRKQIFGALYSKQYDLIAIYCANANIIVTIYQPNQGGGMINKMIENAKKESDRLDNINTPMYFQIQLDLFDLEFKIHYCIDNKNKDNFKKYTQEYNELLAII